MTKLVQEMRHYYLHHTKRITQLTHYVGVPSIVFSLLIITGWVHISVPTIFSTNLAWLFVISLLAYYFLLDWQLALLMTAIMLPITWLSGFISQPEPSLFGLYTFLVLFIGGWILQLIGHVFEGKRPALMNNFQQVFIAPLFLLAELCFALGYRQDLAKLIHAKD